MNSEWLNELWRFRELFYFLAWRDVKVRYKQTILGVAWAVLQPLLTMIIFLVVFGRVAQMSTDGTPGPLFYFAGLVPWIYFSVAIGNSANSLVGNSNLLTKVYFPRSILPASPVLSGLVDYAFGGLFLAGFLAYYRIVPNGRLLLWPVITLLLAMMTYGVGLFLAALTVKFRDVKYATPFFIQLGLFVTPVIYPVSFIPEKYRTLIALNPLTGIIDSYRAMLIPTSPLHWDWLAISAVMSLLVLVGGSVYFSKTERAFGDLV